METVSSVLAVLCGEKMCSINSPLSSTTVTLVSGVADLWKGLVPLSPAF